MVVHEDIVWNVNYGTLQVGHRVPSVEYWFVKVDKPRAVDYDWGKKGSILK